jgi:hypothetical protein
MWDMQQSCNITAKEQLVANGREKITTHAILSQIPHIYYKDITERIIVDKCRSWTIPANIEMLRNYIDKNYKVIILVRSIVDIVKSFIKLYKANGITDATADIEKTLLTPNSEPIMRSIAGVNWANKNNRKNNFLFVKYEDLIGTPEATMKQIYDFCGWEHFSHTFDKVVCKYPENDEVYGLKGMHRVHHRVGVRENTSVLSPKTLVNCQKIDKLMGFSP